MALHSHATTKLLNETSSTSQTLLSADQSTSSLIVIIHVPIVFIVHSMDDGDIVVVSFRFFFFAGFIGHLLGSKLFIPFNKLTNCFLIVYPLITRIVLLSSDGSIHLSSGLIVSESCLLERNKHFCEMTQFHIQSIHLFFVSLNR